MTGNKRFNFGAFCEMDRFTRTHFPDMTSSAFHVYHSGLPYLERILCVGLGGLVAVRVDKWAEASGVTAKTIGVALRELAGKGLIGLTPGSAKTRRCNSVRRKLISELKRRLSPDVLQATIPKRAEELANRLGRIPISWRGETVTPTYTVAKTGRIYMRSPNLQSSTERERFPNLAHNLPDGWQLTSCDYKAAEPTLLFHALRQQGFETAKHEPATVYQHVASFRRIAYPVAKHEFLALVYSPWKDISIPANWNVPQDDYLQEVIGAVNRYRQHLWQIGAPTKTEPRHVNTMMGRMIKASLREKMHRGKLLSWHLQGSLADIFLDALSHVLEAHDTGRLQFCLQLHDSVIVATPLTGANEIQHIMVDASTSRMLPLSTEQRLFNRATLDKGVILPQSRTSLSEVNLPPKGGWQSTEVAT